MTSTQMEDLIRNIDLRLARVEQILPTLATKADLEGFATKADLQGFATKADLEDLATKAEIRELATKAEVREEGERTRRHFDAVAERLEGHIRLVAEGQMMLGERVEARFRQVDVQLASLDRRVMRLEANEGR